MRLPLCQRERHSVKRLPLARSTQKQQAPGTFVLAANRAPPRPRFTSQVDGSEQSAVRRRRDTRLARQSGRRHSRRSRSSSTSAFSNEQTRGRCSTRLAKRTICGSELEAGDQDFRIPARGAGGAGAVLARFRLARHSALDDFHKSTRRTITVVPLCLCERQPRPISAGLNETVGWAAKQAPGMT